MSGTDSMPAVPAEIEIHCQQCGEAFLVPTGEDGRPLRSLCGGCSGGGKTVGAQRPRTTPPRRNG